MIYASIGFVILVVVMILVAQTILKNKIQKALSENLPPSIELNYSDFDLNLFSGYFQMNSLELKQFDDTTQVPNAHLLLDKLRIGGLSYWNYLVNHSIEVGMIEFEHPEITYYQYKKPQERHNDSAKVSNFERLVKIDDLLIKNASISIINRDTDSLIMHTKSLQLKIKDLTYRHTKPLVDAIVFQGLDAQIDEFYSQISKYENVTIKKARLKNDEFIISDLHFFTKYSKSEFSRIIPHEQDHYNITVDSLVINNPSVLKDQDTLINVLSDRIALSNPSVQIYRDKLVYDDNRYKKMYSEMLRNLKFKLLIDSMELKHGSLLYTERARPNTKAGEISISDLNVFLKNVGNLNSENETIILANANFMDHAPIKVDWQFKVSSSNDQFLFKAEINNLRAEDLNRFTEPNLNKRLEGTLERTYFTIDGNTNTSNVDLKVQYDEFDIIALKKNKKEENKVLSKAINIFVSKDSKKSQDGYKLGKKTGIERNKTKSIFNFILHNLEMGLLKAMTID